MFETKGKRKKRWEIIVKMHTIDVIDKCRIPKGDWERCFSVLARAWDKEKNSESHEDFSISLPNSKLTISLISIYKHYAIDNADPSSMQDACHMNFVIKLADRGVCGSVVEHRSVESEGLRFDSSWRLRIFSLSHARDKTKKHLFLFLYQGQNLPSPLFLSTRWDRFETLCSKTIEFGRNNKRRFLRVSVKNTKTWIIPCRRILHSHIR